MTSPADAWSITLNGLIGQVTKTTAGVNPTSGPPIPVGDPARDSLARVRPAIERSGQSWPSGRIVLTSHARFPSSALDLAFACAVLAVDLRVPRERLDQVVLLGELDHDGALRAVRGVLPALLAARAAGFAAAIVPAHNLAEARLVEDITVYGAARLGDVTSWLRGETDLPTSPPASPADAMRCRPPDMADMREDHPGRLPVELVAAGGHHLLLVAPFGAGAAMLAERLPGLLPSLDPEQALQVAALRSLAGQPVRREGSDTPPYVFPPCSSSTYRIFGGLTTGSTSRVDRATAHPPRPGAVSLAHAGVLYLHLAAEFQPPILKDLAMQLNYDEVELPHAVYYPARFQLVMATPPCPCWEPDADCSCGPAQRCRYLQRLPARLLDRIDVRARLPLPDLTGCPPRAGESTATVRARVLAARAAAAARWPRWPTNAAVPGEALRGRYRLPSQTTRALDQALRAGAVTLRGVYAALRVAWTLADLAGRTSPDHNDIEQALDFHNILILGEQQP